APVSSRAVSAVGAGEAAVQFLQFVRDRVVSAGGGGVVPRAGSVGAVAEPPPAVEVEHGHGLGADDSPVVDADADGGSEVALCEAWLLQQCLQSAGVAAGGRCVVDAVAVLGGGEFRVGGGHGTSCCG